MADYRLYCHDASGKMQVAELIAANDDGEAMIIARSMKKTIPCEIWKGDRFVARLPALQFED